MSEQPLISGRGTCWKDKRSPNTYRYYFSLGIKDPKPGRYRRSPTYTVRCKTKTEAMAAMLAKLAEINSSGTISKTKSPICLRPTAGPFMKIGTPSETRCARCPEAVAMKMRIKGFDSRG